MADPFANPFFREEEEITSPLDMMRTLQPQQAAPQTPTPTPTPAPQVAPEPVEQAPDQFTEGVRAFDADLEAKMQRQRDAGYTEDQIRIWRGQRAKEHAKERAKAQAADLVYKRRVQEREEKARVKAIELPTGSKNKIIDKMTRSSHALDLIDQAEAIYRPEFSSGPAAYGAEATRSLQSLLGESLGGGIAEGVENVLSHMSGGATDLGDMTEFTADRAAWKSVIDQMVQEYRHAITGAQSGFKEVKFLENVIPNPNDPPEVFKAKTRAMQQALLKARNAQEKMLNAGLDITKINTDEDKALRDQIQKEAGFENIYKNYQKERNDVRKAREAKIPAFSDRIQKGLSDFANVATWGALGERAPDETMPLPRPGPIPGPGSLPAALGAGMAHAPATVAPAAGSAGGGLAAKVGGQALDWGASYALAKQLAGPDASEKEIMAYMVLAKLGLGRAGGATGLLKRLRP